MKIDEAMTDLSIQREVKRRLGKDHEAESIGLGIEALNRLRNLRDLHGDNTTYPRPTIRHAIALLPSETYIPESVGILPSDEPCGVRSCPGVSMSLALIRSSTTFSLR